MCFSVIATMTVPASVKTLVVTELSLPLHLHRIEQANEILFLIHQAKIAFRSALYTIVSVGETSALLRGCIELREIHPMHHPRERGKNLRLWRDIACSDGLGTQKAFVLRLFDGCGSPW